jgi:tetratricopeptide (TPR) repeat protein
MEKLIACGLAVTRGETDPRLFLEYAEALWNVRDLQATIEALNRAIAGSPRLPETVLAHAYASRAICHLQMADLEHAATDATVSIGLLPRGHAYGLRAITRLFQGRIAEAVADVETGIQIDPDDWEVRAWRARILLTIGRYAEALDDFTSVVATGECVRFGSQLHLDMARCHLALGNPGAAIPECDQAIDEDFHEQSHWPFIVQERARTAHEPYLVRAEARVQLGQMARALGDCCFAASIAPGDPAVYELRARVYYAVGNLHEVVRDTIRADYLRRKSDGLTASTPIDRSDQLVGSPA